MKLRSVFSIALSVAGLAAIGLATAQIGADGYSYRLPGVGMVSLAGVCSADPELITCWTPSGDANPKLSELMSAYYLVNPQQRLEIRYKHRSLMLVTRALIDNLPGRGNINFNGLEVDPGGQLNSQGAIGYGGQGEATTSFYWYYPPDDLASVDATGVLNVSSDSVKLPLKVGAKAQLQGGMVQITSIRKASSQSVSGPHFGYQQPSGPRWIVSYSLVGQGASPVTSIYASVYDRNGDIVSAVDHRGNPTITPRQNGMFFGGGGPAFPLAMANGSQINLAVNPEKVGYLMVTGTAQQRLSFKKVALQPNK
ncbi:MAG: hypothetical protein ACYC96_08315 [Fimbriimonadaceae bacterium]